MLNVPEPVENINHTNGYTDSEDEYPTENNLNQTDFSHTKPIIIESDHVKHNSFNEVDSANHSYDDGVDVVDGIVKPILANGCEYKEDKIDNIHKKLHGNSVDSGISNNVNGVNNNKTGLTNGTEVNSHNNNKVYIEQIAEAEKIMKTLPKRLSDISIKDQDTIINTSSDDDRFDSHSDNDKSPRQKNSNGFINGYPVDKKNGISLNLKLHNEIK